MALHGIAHDAGARPHASVASRCGAGRRRPRSGEAPTSDRWMNPPRAEAGRGRGWTPTSSEDTVPWATGSTRGGAGMPPPGGCARAMPGIVLRGLGRTNVGDCSRAATAEREMSAGGEPNDGGEASLGGGRDPDDLPCGKLGGRERGWPPESVVCQRAVSGPKVGGEKEERDGGERMRSSGLVGTGDCERSGDRDVARHGGM